MERPLALVTGSTRGLGRAVVEQLLGRGWRVVGLARGPAADAPQAADYRHLEADLERPDALADLLKRVLGQEPAQAARFGLVNNAARLDVEATHALDAGHLVASLVVGAAAPAWLMGWALRASGERPLRIVNVSSGAATSAYPGWSAYCQSKAALDMAGAVLGVELAENPDLAGRDVAVSSYSPGVVDTDMQRTLRSADPRAFPRRERFIELARKNELVAPETPAREIADFLEADGQEPFSRRRFGG
jgi:benzil reductase ((S)-benzoin forming)